MKERKFYDRPPLVETIFEVVVPPEKAWDVAVPGMLYERVKTDGYVDHQTRQNKHFVIENGKEDVSQLIQERAVFLTADKLDLIQIGRDLFAVNRLKPYPGWEHFKPRIESAVRHFEEVKPALDTPCKIALRYVNLIAVPREGFHLHDWLAFRPYLESGFFAEPESLITGCIFPFSDGRDRCKLELISSKVRNPEEKAFLLTLDYSTTKSAGEPFLHLFPWIEEAHSNLEELFELCLTERLREHFGVKKQ